MISSNRVGSISIDESQVRGVGTPFSPSLTVPLTIKMTARPMEQKLAVPELWCALSLAQPLSAANQIGPWTRVMNNGAFLAASKTNGETAFGHEVRFPLTPANIEQMEQHRHQAPDKGFEGNLAFRAQVVWVSGIGNGIQTPGQRDPLAIASSPFETGIGPFYTVAPFGQATVSEARFRIAVSEWVDKVLPGIGYNRVRLIEVNLAKLTDLVPEKVITYLNEAFHNFDLGRYRESISSARDVRHALEDSLGATTNRPIADVVIGRLGLPPEDPRRKFLIDAWTYYSKITNAGPHYESGQGVTREDARLCLDVTAAFLEYLGSLLK